MGLKEILEFVKIEHTLFSLPFVFIGAILGNITLQDVHGDIWFGIWPPIETLVWILVAAVGARGLAMGLNRIIDRDIDAENPRTEGRHLASGAMSLRTAWMLCALFTAMLVGGAWMLDPICLYLSPIPVTAFVAYPYLKRLTWGCHFWLGLCLGLAPSGAWLAVVSPDLGWESITNLLWWPTLFWTSLGVLLWIAAFDLQYARMDVDSDRANDIQSFPARFDERATIRTSVQLSLAWFGCFALANPVESMTFLVAAGLMAAANIAVILGEKRFADFQRTFFHVSVATGWVLLGGLLLA